MNKFFAPVATALTLLLVVTPVLAKAPTHGVFGGGQVVADDYRVSFGGNVKETTKGLQGNIQVNFHNVSNEDITGGKFHSTEITDFNWFEGDGDCDAAMNVAMDGRFNGEDGWQLIFRAGDNEDTVRFELTGPGGSYDTNAGDFTGESSCVGTARTGLDRGNVTIR